MKTIRLLTSILSLVLLSSCQISTDLGETKIPKKDAKIYYVKSDRIDNEKQKLSYDVVSITEYWLEKNGFPEDCKLEHHFLTNSFEQIEEIDFSTYYRIDICDQSGNPMLYLFFSQSSKTCFEQSDGLYRQAYVSTMYDYIKNSAAAVK